MRAAFLRPPLWLAGHLPRKGGDWQLCRRPKPSNAENWRKPKRQLISPLAGEMSGRTEGGVTELKVNKDQTR
ncbi:hypothetical protein EFV37_05860 [Mesorhizobium loti]|uniref:Uncharacterized protein n=1 Tax=Mesorhizobium jarvisii TaxID=1777867 RepID=A0A6M7TPM3_9HYPH|nr:hypothetical protein EB229_05860 [Mesorhizobium jarvisii]QKD12736.1 hypothetical protein EFV37_05860 [Mesorhizobium loti]RJT35991.1 hypothetical protein D3242_08840 [Mesorhizobium jarvisii]